MSQPTDRFSRAMAGIDAFNARDPNRLEVAGKSVAKELYYGQRMSHWLIGEPGWEDVAAAVLDWLNDFETKSKTR